MNNLQELLAKHQGQAGAPHFGEQLGRFINDLSPSVVVETGYGVSTLFILAALDANGLGDLISVDPKPWFPDRIEHPRNVLVERKSVDALPEIFRRTGPWDLFLHDSNHDVECMTFELEFAYGCIKPDGWIACDDHTWGNHGAWAKFRQRWGLGEIMLGSLAMVQKPGYHGHAGGAVQLHEENCRALAKAAVEECLSAGTEVVSAAFRE